MPQWLLYMLAGIGALTIIGAIIISIKNYFESKSYSIDSRVQSLKRTVYDLELHVAETIKSQKTQHGLLLEAVGEMKVMARNLVALNEWKKKISTVTDTWDVYGSKENGPDGL